MTWYKKLVEFWKSNLEQNVKKLSIGFGSFLIVILVSCTLPLELFIASIYGAGVSFGSMLIMSIFGKNGNHYLSDKESELPESEFKPESEPEQPKETNTLP